MVIKMINKSNFLSSVKIRSVGTLRGRDCKSAEYEGIPLLTWTEEINPSYNEPHFTTINQFGYEKWYVLASDGEWRPQYVNGVETPCLIVPASRLAKITKMAITKRFGDALELTNECVRDFPRIRRYGDWVSSINGEIVLRWETDANRKNLVCTDPTGEFTYIGSNPSSGSFVPSEEVDPGFEWWEISENFIPGMAVFARKAWNDRQY